MRFRIAALCVLIASAALLASNAVVQDPALEQAWSLAGNGDRAGAASLLREILRREPRNVEAHLFLGSLLLEENQREESLAHLQQAVQLRPKSTEALNGLGEGYLHFGDPKSARECFE